MKSPNRWTTPHRRIASGAALALGLALVTIPASAQQTAKDSAAADSAAKAAAAAAAKQAACGKVKAYAKQVATDTIKALWKAGQLFNMDTTIKQPSVKIPQLTLDQSKAPDSIRTAMTDAGPSCSAGPTPQTMMQLAQTMLSAPRPVIGVQFQPLTARDTAGLGLPAVRGLLVQGVTPGFGAADAGIVKGDAIIALEGQPLVTANQFLQAASSWKDGQTINVEVVHKGGTHQKVGVVAKMSK